MTVELRFDLKQFCFIKIINKQNQLFENINFIKYHLLQLLLLVKI